MIFIPHGYQAHAIRFIEEHPVSAIFLQMGLGKSVIALTAIADLLFDSFVISRVLVIAPLRVAKDTWPSEIVKWDHLSSLTFAVAVGTPAEREAAVEARADITIINRENVQWLAEECHAPFDFDMIVVDELSSFKSHTSKRFKALMKKRRSTQRMVGLTGTPSSNGLMDLWAEFKLLDMGKRLGWGITRFRDEFFLPDKRNGNIVYSYKPRKHAEEGIYERIGDITMSMKATDHLAMPELVLTRREVILSKAEAARYDELKRNLVLDDGNNCVTASNATSLSNKLAQMANGAVYDDAGCILPIHDRKLDALEDIIEEANGRTVLVAYWFRHDLARISRKFEVRDIKTPEDIADWNAGRIPVACIHPASAGHGLNLQAGGSLLVWFGVTWSLELYQQTNARLWRQGQKSGTVVITHILAKDTIDERIMDALDRKDVAQSALIDAVKASL
ncbi:MAG: DEAD/DEAH box helicase [Clostridia bacterium]|nr:DEAD/DEAH box helicase [Clostridia bacterium]